MSVMSEFDQALQDYAEYIFQDFAQWRRLCKAPAPTKEDFTVEFMPGKKFIRVATTITGQRSSHSFVVFESSEKFKFGDILKAASWAAPAKNFSRGNVMTGDFGKIAWTGA